MAEFMANTTLEIAEKIGDYTTQTSILELMLHLFIILKNDKLISKAASQLELAQKHRQIILDIITGCLLNGKVKNEETEEYVRKVKTYINHTEKPIMLTARYAWLQQKYNNSSTTFFGSDNQKMLSDNIRDFNNSFFTVLPYMFDLRSKLQFLRLNSIHSNLNKQEDKKEFQALLKHIKSISYWNHLLSQAELSHFTIRASFYTSHYSF